MSETKKPTVFIFRCLCGEQHRTNIALFYWVEASREAGELGWRIMPRVVNNVAQGYALHCPKCAGAAA